MKSYRIVSTVTVFALTCLFISSVINATAAKPPPPPEDTRKLVKSVHVPDSTVVIQNMRDKTLHTYTIDEITALKVNNITGKISDIKPGMVVDDFLERNDQILDSLTLSGYGEEPTKPKPKPKPKPKTPPPAQT